MDVSMFLLGLLLTIVPMIELRGGLPVAFYSVKNSGSLTIALTFLLVVAINVFLIFLIFWFLETLHHRIVRWGFYERYFERYLVRLQRKSHRVAGKEGMLVFVSLCLFVAVPLPLTGAYSGTVLAWFLDLDRRKSVLAIGLGVLIAAVLIFLAMIGVAGLVGG